MRDSQPLRALSVQDASLADHAWRVGARNRDQAIRSLDTELEAIHNRFNAEPSKVVTGLAVASTVSPRYV
ncbi:MAG: hypothetical protein M3Q79_00350 [bacterium]|nr:hypothetical protein [bacterium]